MPNVTLSADFVRTAFCPEGKAKIDFYDTATVGFILECRSSGGKTFALRYRNSHGKQCQHKIGDAASISFDRAKQTAQQLRSQVVLTGNVAEDRKLKRSIPTLAEFVADKYLPHIKIVNVRGPVTIRFCERTCCRASENAIWTKSNSKM